MKNLLNNRWFIIAMTIAAALLLARSIILPFVSKPTFTNDTTVDDWMDASLPTENNSSHERSLKPASTDKLVWNNHPRRDPFSPHITIGHQDLLMIRNQANAITDDISYTQPALSALVAGKISKYAVINGTIVQEGDSIAGFKIHRIEPDGVWLLSGNGLQKLVLSKSDKE